MKPLIIDVKQIADMLREQCPFILFAMLTGPDKEGWLKWPENLQLSVFIGSDIGSLHALEQILPVMETSVPQVSCDVTLMNKVDPGTRFRAIQGQCLFIRKGREQQYFRFVQQSCLDYKIMRAQQRRKGIIEND